MYIKIKDKELFQELEKNLLIPKKWSVFINNNLKKHNLIIKNKKTYYCTNCKKNFDSNVNVNNLLKCPYCHLKLMVKSKRLKKYNFKDYLSVLDKYKNYMIQRLFVLESYLDNTEIKSSYYEFGRIIYDSDFKIINEIINDNVIGTISGYWISYRKNSNYNWRYSESYKSPISYLDEFINYPYNLKKVLPERYKYSKLWVLAKKVEYCNLIYILKNYNYSVELLIKSRLYNLALCPKSFANKNSFEERFMGLSKSYFSFIRKYNLDIDELKALSVIKVKDINLVKRVKIFHDCEILARYGVDFCKVFDLTNLNLINYVEYKDYLKFATMLKMNLKDSKILYPKDIKKSHDQLLKQVEIMKNKSINKTIKKIANIIKSTKYKDNKYVIFPAESFEQLIEESNQQNNCVKTYAEKIASGESYIYFMRELKDINRSLVTVEVKNKKIVQKRTKNNEITTKEQDRFLNKWQNLILKNSEVIK